MSTINDTHVTSNGCEIIAATKYVSRSCYMDARVILVKQPDDDGYVTALQTRQEDGRQNPGWGQGHYFDVKDFGRAFDDFGDRARVLLLVDE